MKKLIIRFLSNLAARFILISTLLNRLWCIYFILDFRKIYVRDSNYSKLVVKRSEREPSLGDERTNFTSRIILDKNYERLIEIGAYDLARPLYYKKVFPHLEVHALDIIKEFAEESVPGINLAPFSIEWLQKNSGAKTLISSTGTLPCMEPDELRVFLEATYLCKYDLALAEIGSHFAKNTSLKRNLTSYYHPYQHLLEQIGFEVMITHPNHAFSLSGMERREFIFAISS